MDCDHLIDEIQDLRRERDEVRQEVVRLRAALEQIADDGVIGYESPQKRIALAALDT